jgi:DNA-binding response OmpR family regulator
VPDVLIATDADWVHDEVEAALVDDDTRVLRIRHGVDVRGAVRETEPDLVVLDLQIGQMGGIAACLDLRHEEGAGRLLHVPVLILLDRHADVFLARRADADGWLVKPLDAFRVRRAALQLLAGGTHHESTGMETVPPDGPADTDAA